MLDLFLWILVHLGSALGAFVVIVIWAVIIFVVVDEIIALFRGDDPTESQDGETR